MRTLRIGCLRPRLPGLALCTLLAVSGEAAASTFTSQELQPTWTLFSYVRDRPVSPPAEAPDGDDPTFLTLDDFEFLSYGIGDILQARDGSVWVATDQHGVWRYGDGRWTGFGIAEGALGASHAENLFEGEDGAIWVVYDFWSKDGSGSSPEGQASGISRYQDGRWTRFPLPKEGFEEHASLDQSHRARDGSFWFLTSGGLARFADGRWEAFRAEALATVRELVETAAGTIWVRTEKQRLLQYRAGRWEDATPPDLEYAGPLLLGRDSSLWMAAYRGIWHHNGTGWESLKDPELADSNGPMVVPVLAARNGSILCRSPRGLVSFEAGRWTALPSADLGFSIAASLEAGDGSLWFSSDKGLFRLRQGRWSQFPELEILFQGLGHVDVLLEAGDGSVWIATSKGGLARFQGERWTFFSDFWPLPRHSDLEVKAWLVAPGGGLWLGLKEGSLLWFRPSRGELHLAADVGSPVVDAALEVGEGRKDPAQWRLLYDVGSEGSGPAFSMGFDAASRARIAISPDWGRSFQLRALAMDKDGTVVSAEPARMTLAGEASSSPGEAIEVEDPDLARQLRGSGGLKLNDVTVQSQSVPGSPAAVRLLGGGNFVRQGLNMVQTAKGTVTAWYEGGKLKKFDQPYRDSYAVIVAIDDYDRKKDSRKRGPTGYQELPFMVKNARALADVLERSGFPRDHIVTLFDEQATSAKVEEALESFWEGGSRAGADRLFFYFGGHGDVAGSVPFLVTYDFDRRRPTATSFLMRDLTSRHPDNLRPRHVLMAIDSCFAGLALPIPMSGGPDAAKLADFRTLALIRADVEPPARNLLVAGTGDQRALWENGGIFTRALVSGLKGDADLNRDGVIQFDELAVQVNRDVAPVAAASGHLQRPGNYVLRNYGEGRVLFLRPPPTR